SMRNGPSPTGTPGASSFVTRGTAPHDEPAMSWPPGTDTMGPPVDAAGALALGATSPAAVAAGADVAAGVAVPSPSASPESFFTASHPAPEARSAAATRPIFTCCVVTMVRSPPRPRSPRAVAPAPRAVALDAEPRRRAQAQHV